MSAKLEISELKIQKSIRELGKVYHADSEINQDDLPVYFKLAVSKGFWLVVDMVKRDEIGIMTVNTEYKKISQMVAEMLLAIADERREMVAEHKAALEELRQKQPLAISYNDRIKKYPWGDIVPERVDVNYSAGPYVLQEEEIPENTPIGGGS